jgi:hypothetical protein
VRQAGPVHRQRQDAAGSRDPGDHEAAGAPGRRPHVKLYLVLDYRHQHGTLPFGPMAASLTRAGTIVELLFPLVILLFLDGRLPSPRWRWTLWVYLAAGGLGVAGTLAGQAIAVSGQRIRVDALGQPTNGAAGIAAVLMGVGFLLTVVGVAISLSWVARLVISYRRSAGERRQQTKWLAAGVAVFVVSLVAFELVSSQVGQASRAIAFSGSRPCRSAPAWRS